MPRTGAGTVTTAIEISDVWHHYGPRAALAGLSLEIGSGEIFALLGPNGGGKTTLFRLLTTLVPVARGRIEILGCDVGTKVQEVRRRIGVVFQAPSVDRHLTVSENLWHQGQLYGLHGRRLAHRIDALLSAFGLSDRARDFASKLSGGLRRRVEVAKGLLHEPQILLLDEPSTGLDPAVRRELWNYLERIRDEQGVTVLLTTHLFEEAEKADRLAILDAGHLVAEGSPDDLRREIGGDTVTIECDRPELIAASIVEKFGWPARVVEGLVRFERADAHQVIAQVVEAYPGQLRAVTYGKPTLEDVWVARTGRRQWQRAESES